MNDFEYEFKEPYESYFNWGGVQLSTREGEGLMGFIYWILLSLISLVVFVSLLFIHDLSEQIKVLKDDVYRLEHPVLEGME